MEKGSVAYDGGEMVPASMEYYLVRAPKEFDLALLNGVAINFQAEGETPIPNTTYKVRVDHEPHGHKLMRPLVQNAASGQSHVGPAFTANVTILQDFSALLGPPSAEAIPVNAYKPIPQVTNLKVQFMPKGSETSVASLWSSKERKRVRELPVAAGVDGEEEGGGKITKDDDDDDDDNNEEEEKERKRRKREKKEKKREGANDVKQKKSKKDKR